ncbi:MAG: hypothetical protein II342_01205 [Clostridia bacterium]|nr:hypothetical protein [Clostridia bacterium]
MELPKREKNRLKNYDYSQEGAYFITICVKDRKPILSKVRVGTGEIPLLGEMSEGQKGNGEAVTPTVREFYYYRTVKLLINIYIN